MWLMVTVLDSEVLNFHVFECCWSSQIWLYLDPLHIYRWFSLCFWWGCQASKVMKGAQRFSLAPELEVLPCPFGVSPPPPSLSWVFSGKREWLVSWSCKVLEWAHGDDGGDFLVLKGQCYFVWICRKENVHHFKKKKQICSQKKEEGRQLTFIEQISSYIIWVVHHLG